MARTFTGTPGVTAPLSQRTTSSSVLFTRRVFLTCVFSAVRGVYVRPSLFTHVHFFPFQSPFPCTQLKSRQHYWLRGLCIPLGWWRGLSSEHSLQPGADRSFTSTSLSNTARRETAPGEEVCRRYTYLQTNNLTHQHWHTHSRLSKKVKTGTFFCYTFWSLFKVFFGASVVFCFLCIVWPGLGLVLSSGV